MMLLSHNGEVFLLLVGNDTVGVYTDSETTDKTARSLADEGFTVHAFRVNIDDLFELAFKDDKAVT